MPTNDVITDAGDAIESANPPNVADASEKKTR